MFRSELRMSSQKSQELCSALPPGWIRETSRRTNGVSSGRLDVLYVSPAGKKIRNKNDLIKEIGETFDLSGFDYSAGKMGSSLIKSGRSRKPVKKPVTDANLTTNLNSLISPIRQTASIFKQPVTVFKTHETQVKNIKSEKEKPRQLFWEMRLSNITSSNVDDELFEMSLPRRIKELECLQGQTSNSTLLASISTALHLDKKPVLGQVRKIQSLNQLLKLN